MAVSKIYQYPTATVTRYSSEDIWDMDVVDYCKFRSFSQELWGAETYEWYREQFVRTGAMSYLEAMLTKVEPYYG